MLSFKHLVIKTLREHRWLQQSLTRCHYNHLSASQKEAKCHIIGRCVKSFLFQLGTKGPSSLFPPSHFNSSPHLSLTLPQISVSPGCPALLRCMVLHETYDNLSWLASSHPNYGCLLLWWTRHACRRATDPQPHELQLSSHHVWAFVFKETNIQTGGLAGIRSHRLEAAVHLCSYWNVFKRSAVDKRKVCIWSKQPGFKTSSCCDSAQVAASFRTKVIDDDPDDLSFHWNILTNFFEPFRAL